MIKNRLFSKMAKGKSLSEFEKSKVLAYRDEELSNPKIVEKLGRNHREVNNFVNYQQDYGKGRSYGRESKLTEREKRLILRAESNSTK